MLVNTETHIDWVFPDRTGIVKRSAVAIALGSYVGHKVLSGLRVVKLDEASPSQTAFQIYGTFRTNRLHQVVRQCEGDLC